MSSTPIRRCAIYTRKSTEEGLEQAFNSLDAQREACEAYILSQAGEGWTLVPEQYDDGGWSGGNMDRPALKALLADIAKGRVDIVVVYKVDRLTRSLMDFARIVETFDKNNASFVSVTQAFNTTNSMGRLTLNVLLSFAQFEREVTGERIRDKIAASRAKGIFMGGYIPLGYDLGERKLEVNAEEAAIVRAMFCRYLELKSIPALTAELAEQGIRSKRWTSRAGIVHGGLPMRVGAVTLILNNRTYRGEAVHKGKAYAGEHAAIVSDELFAAVQTQLQANRVTRSQRKTKTAGSPLTGKLYDSDGAPMRVRFCCGRGRRIYRYYVSECLLSRTAHQPSNHVGQRLSAARVERVLSDALGGLLASYNMQDKFALVERVTLAGNRLAILVDLTKLPAHASQDLLLSNAEQLDPRARIEADQLQLSIVLPPDRRGRSTRSPDAAMLRADDKAALAALVRIGHKRLLEIYASPLKPQTHSRMRAPASVWIRQRATFGLLAPDIQKALLTGIAPAHVTLDWVLTKEWPVCWEAQRRMLGTSD